MIFVQIAAYRDPELVPTILDCLSKAKYPNDLTFGICWQTDTHDESLQPFKETKNFRIDRVPWEESQGLCWARSRIQSLYDGEEFTLQIDSHHRFATDWDQKLMQYLELTGSSKPLLTSYAGIYEPQTNDLKSTEPFKMVADKFTPSGTILFRPHGIHDWQTLSKPMRARFVSGHFFFTTGQHCTEYKYDPRLYFAGDEISLSIRSFTLGYDLFHPHRLVLWHEYSRHGRIKHWDDHTTENKHMVQLAWHERDVISKMRLRKLLREEENDADISGYDLGSVRTHRDYEIYAGIDFANRRLQQTTLNGSEPPCEHLNDQQWEAGFASDYQLAIQWNIHDIEPCDDCQFIYFGIEDDAGTVLYRYDAPPDSAEAQLITDHKTAEFRSSSKPSKLTLWPVSRSRGWLKRVDYAL